MNMINKDYTNVVSGSIKVVNKDYKYVVNNDYINVVKMRSIMAIFLIK